MRNLASDYHFNKVIQVYDATKAVYNRTTVYWSPMVKTDNTGKTTVSFFTTDDAANLRILMEGLDKTGKVGVGKGVFKTN